MYVLNCANRGKKAEFLLEQNQLNSQIYSRSDATEAVVCLFVCFSGCVVLDEVCSPISLVTLL